MQLLQEADIVEEDVELQSSDDEELDDTIAKDPENVNILCNQYVAGA